MSLPPGACYPNFAGQHWACDIQANAEPMAICDCWSYHSSCCPHTLDRPFHADIVSSPPHRPVFWRVLHGQIHRGSKGCCATIKLTSSRGLSMPWPAQAMHGHVLKFQWPPPLAGWLYQGLISEIAALLSQVSLGSVAI